MDVKNLNPIKKKGFCVSETLRLVVTKFNHESLTIFSVLLFLTTLTLILYWFYNRKKFHDLSHQIPASVVKTYLDTIIQNSNSLKSSLFRGGGLDLTQGVPSVVPLSELGSMPLGGNSEELNQKIAEIASLNHKLHDKSKQVVDLEKKLQEISSGSFDSNAEVQGLKKEVKDLTQKLQDAQSQSASSGAKDGELTKEVNTLKKDKEALQNRLKEYEIIEEDLANLKRLQQENEQLKNEIEELKKRGSVSAPAPAPVEIPDTVADSDIDLEAEMAKAIAESQAKPVQEPTPVADIPMEVTSLDDIPVDEGEQKSAEELLSEFEKMLG